MPSAARVSRQFVVPGAAGFLLLASVSHVRADILAPIWTGLYIGAHGGAKWSDVDTDFSSKFSATNASGGGHAGVNIGLGAIVVGVEADASVDSTELKFLTSGGNATFESDWSGTVRGRVGIPVGPALLYATAGYAWTSATLSEATLGGNSSSADLTFHGVVYGLGAEAYVLPNLSLRLEALRFDYGTDELSLAGAGGAIEEFDPSETVVRAGLTFHLN